MIPFTKMQGCGNDYIYLDCTKEPDADRLSFDAPALSRRVSDRHFGIGSDGLILICSSDKADFQMRMFNADGSESEMCGNGIRCVAKYVFDKGLTQKTEISVETLAGTKHLLCHLGKDGLVATVTVNMGKPLLSPAMIPVKAQGSVVIDEPIEADGKQYRMTCVSMGNPHAVLFVEDTASFPVADIGPTFEEHPRFPNRTNTEFVQVISPTEIMMRVWERGSGETLACGTGACASVRACILNQKTEDTVLVHLLGGDLSITYDRKNDHMLMTGPAVTVFEGRIQ